MKVLVGMSGGVDSSMAAYLLKEAGHEVEGMSLILYEARTRPSETACCSIHAIEDAARAARQIGIPHSALDVRAEFIEKVIEPFIESYSGGLTPNPCVLCNRHIKFPFLLGEAKKRGADSIATGHYAKVEKSGGRLLLKRGIDIGKDQSYVLYVLGDEELERLILPLGYHLKDDIRSRARGLGLPAAPESQEICFIEDGDYAAFVGSFYEGRPGPIIGPEGRAIGTHRGIHRYTVGQRKGLGIASPEPLYVTAIDAEHNSIHVGRAALFREFTVSDLRWLLPAADPIRGPRAAFRAAVKVRSAMRPEPALVRAEGADRVRVVFDSPRWAPAPGQSAVFYDGDTVVGGGIIERAEERP